ncbi:MAG: hypothetical protein Q7R88_01375 [bacterium]|nr:hypothetical protein [bacterium]
MQENKTSIELKMVSLKQVIHHDYVDSVTLPTKAGEITVLPNHTALISALGAGTIRARAGGKELPFQIQGGFMEVTPDSRLVVLLS